MPKNIKSSITHLDELPEEECKHIPLNCIWPITSLDTNLTVIITCLKWTFNFEFCIRVTAYQLGSPNISKQIDLDDHHPLLRSLTDALHLHEAFPEPNRDAESCSQLTEAATLWKQMKMNFITRFSDGRNKFRHRLEVKHCWPDDMNGIPNAQQNAERATQKRQQKQRYRDYSLRGLKTEGLQIKAQEQLMACPNVTQNDVSTQIFQEDVMLQVCPNFLHDVEQIKIELATMRQEVRNLRTELQEHRVNCLEGSFRPWTPTQKGIHKTVRFCNFCHKNGHTPKWCRRKMRDEEIRRVQHDMTFYKNIAHIREYGTSDSNCRSQHDQNVDRCLDSDDVNIPTNALLSTEDETCQDESNDVTPLQPKFISTTNGMSFRMAQFNSAEEADDELSYPLPLGY